MQHEEDYEEDWKIEAPTLASLDKDVELEVPEGYFDDLPSHVMARIQAMATAEAAPVEAPARTLPGRMSPWRQRVVWGIAASLALLVAVGAFYLSGSKQPVATDVNYAVLNAQLDGVATETLVENLDPSMINDDQLLAMLGDDASSAFEGHDHAVKRDEAYEYLQDADLDAIDLQGLDIDMNDL